jgi:hypothetical protein
MLLASRKISVGSHEQSKLHRGMEAKYPKQAEVQRPTLGSPWLRVKLLHRRWPEVYFYSSGFKCWSEAREHSSTKDGGGLLETGLPDGI